VPLLRQTGLALARARGVIVQHEVDFSAPLPTWPHAPLEDHTYRLLGDSFRKLGKWPDAGKRLSRIFLDAGLPTPTVGARLPVSAARGTYLYDWLAETVRSLLPMIEREGLASTAEIGPESLPGDWRRRRWISAARSSDRRSTARGSPNLRKGVHELLMVDLRARESGWRRSG
jgi:hypothetical protein